jgi:hypothetical protein
VIRELGEGRLFAGKQTDLKQPPLFQHRIKQNAGTARGGDFDSSLRTFRHKYDINADELIGLTKEIFEKCNPPKS